MKKYRILIAIISVLAAVSGVEARTITFSGNTLPVFDTVPPATTGLNHIYILSDVSGVAMHYEADDPMETVEWTQYGELGGAYEEPVTGIVTEGPGRTMLPQVKANTGYIIKEGDYPTYVWVADYSMATLNVRSLTFGEMGDCGTATIDVNGTGSDIVYYTINGIRRVFDRGLKMTYHTRRWDEENSEWTDTLIVEDVEIFKHTIVVPAPLCDTEFTLTGDNLLAYWNQPLLSVPSPLYETIAVDVRATAVQDERYNDNEQKNPEGSNTLGGSAPVHIVFTGYPTDAVVYREWQMSTDYEFNNLELRLNQDVVEQDFDEAGVYYWRYIVGNADGTCEASSDVYTVDIGISDLQCPNVFTPGTSEGVNDVWKVSYKSITEFHCAIFSRYGVKVAEFDDPGQGWDGRYGGKLVKAGVYFYVIEARGADGRQYKLSGDINIIRYKKRVFDDPVDPDPTNPVDPVEE